MQKILATILSIFVLLMGAILIVPSFMDWNSYKDQITKPVRQMLGLDLLINSDLSVRLLPSPALYAKDVVLQNPTQQGGEDIIRLQRLDVNLDILPLLKGNVSVRSIDLQSPRIYVEVAKDGSMNWQTPQISEMQNNPKTNNEQKSGNGFIKDLSIDKISIENGTFLYSNAQSDTPISVQDINMNVSMKGFDGPFFADGRLSFNDVYYDFDAKTGALQKSNGRLSAIPFLADIKSSLFNARFDGGVDMMSNQDTGAQLAGGLSLSLPSLKKLAEDAGQGHYIKKDTALVLNSIILANAKDVRLSEVTLKGFEQQANGDLSIALDPIVINANFAFLNTLDLDEYVALDKKTKTPNNGANFGAIIPQTLTIPVALNADLTLSAPAVRFQNAEYKNVSLNLGKNNAVFKGGLSLSNLTGGGNVSGAVDLSYASQSKTDKAVMYSDPKMNYVLDAKFTNLSQFINTIGYGSLPYISQVKKADLNFKGGLSGNKIVLNKSKVQLDDTDFIISGSYDPIVKGRPKLNIDLGASNFDFNAFMAGKTKGQNASKNKSDIRSTLEAINVPYDVQFDLGVENGKIKEYDVKGLRLKGDLKVDQLTLENLSAQNVAGASFKAQGGINNFKTLQGVDVFVQGQTKDIKRLARAFDIDQSSFPADLTDVSFAVKAYGSSESLNISSDINALGGQIMAKGAVKNVLTSADVSGLVLQIKHANTGRALKSLAPGLPYYTSLNKPMDLYMDVDIAEKSYTAKNIKGVFGGSQINGSLQANMSGALPYYKADIRMGEVAFKSGVGGTAATPSKSGNSNGNETQNASTGGSKWSSAPINGQWLDTFNGDFAFSSPRFEYETWDLKDVKVSGVLKNGTLNVTPINAGLYGGSLKNNVKMSAAKNKAIDIAFGSSIKSVDLEQIVGSFVGSRILNARGVLNLETDIKSLGGSQRSLVGNLSGTGQMSGSNIVLEGFDVTRFARALSSETKPGDTLLGLWKGTTKGGETVFNTLDGQYTVNQGIATLNRVVLDGPTAMIETTGQVDLVKWRLDTAHKITVKNRDDVPPFTVNLNGPLDNPGQTFAQGALNDYLSRKLNRKLNDFIGDKLGETLGGTLGETLGLPSRKKPEPVYVPQNDNADDASNKAQDEPPAEIPAPDTKQAPKEFKPEDAVLDILEGLLQ